MAITIEEPADGTREQHRQGGGGVGLAPAISACGPQDVACVTSGSCLGKHHLDPGQPNQAVRSTLRAAAPRA
jgi:hypothetical protein